MHYSRRVQNISFRFRWCEHEFLFPRRLLQQALLQHPFRCGVGWRGGHAANRVRGPARLRTITWVGAHLVALRGRQPHGDPARGHRHSTPALYRDEARTGLSELVGPGQMPSHLGSGRQGLPQGAVEA